MKTLSDNEAVLLLTKGVISELPPTQSKACAELSDQIRRMVKAAGSPVGVLAISIVALEIGSGKLKLE